MFNRSIMAGSNEPEIATVRQILSRYREISW